MHDFQENLEFSLGEREKFDISLLREIISGCTDIRKTDVETDRIGVDYVAYLRKGAQVLIDAKTRKPGASKYWKHNEPELALEIWSVCPNPSCEGKTGWTLNENSPVDMILYTFDEQDSRKFFLLPFQFLRMAFRRNYSNWVNKYGTRIERNKAWTSEAVFVPASVVLNALTEEMYGICPQYNGD